MGVEEVRSQFLTGLRPTTNDENFGFPAGLGDQWVARIFGREVRSQNGNLAIESGGLADTTGTKFSLAPA
jgi:hypothetical protein